MYLALILDVLNNKPSKRYW